VREGLETDTFLCASCGFQFTLDFDESGPATEPLWPPTPEEKAGILKAAALFAPRKPDA
jgi:hypothetical protein